MGWNEGEGGHQGGDCAGETPIDVTMGKALRVARASFYPGYPLKETLRRSPSEPYMDEADLMQGYCDYGVAIGNRDRR